MSKSRASEPRGPSQRQLRVGELIRRSLSELLTRGDLHEPDLAAVSITVGEVRVTPDLKRATCFVLPLGGGDEQGVLDALRRAKPEIRHQLARSMKLKHAPDLKFEIDRSFDRMDETRRLLSDERVRRDVAAVEARRESGDGDEDDA
ncbi:ribosome-binding factor A [Limimaricola variabilis]|uniref:Ribosome-binding factor A n=1 Tax=Limimaricola variabilis TaxID=1492771 RepID=A0ABR6HL99_9RHOB|nr:30S ribosome-binding factor RbfA [Limimaricola variabilis]MBB3711191.1 ribosome-binding factor A [Limimaricola variabilis]WPY93825.1 30S ribosome-binding factor RbfA [Limimaricola variabilis]